MSSKMEIQLAQAKSTLARVRRSAEESAIQFQRLATIVGSAYAAGAYEKSQRAASRPVPSFQGINYKAMAAVGAYFIGPKVGGRMGEAITDAGIGLAAAYAFQEGNT